MILTRLGNKKKLASNIWKYFPPHKMRIELFFGAGGVFFNMPKAKYNILNDLDDDVTNLFLVLKEQKEAFFSAIEMLPISSSLMSYWKNKKEEEPIDKAIRFLFLSNFSLMGKGQTFRLGLDNTKQVILDRIEPTFQALKDVKITNYDFREVLGKVSFSRGVLEKEEAFVYLDPVYFGTTNYRNVPKWKENDTLDCFNIMSDSGVKCAMSEFSSPLILLESKKRGFNVIPIKNRRNIKNIRTEILITNYKTNEWTLF